MQEEKLFNKRANNPWSDCEGRFSPLKTHIFLKGLKHEYRTVVNNIAKFHFNLWHSYEFLKIYLPH